MRRDLQEKRDGIQYYICRYHFSNGTGFELALIEKNKDAISVYKGAKQKNGAMSYPLIPTETFAITDDGADQLRGKLDVDGDGKADDAIFSECPNEKGSPTLTFIITAEQYEKLVDKYNLADITNVKKEGIVDLND